MKVRIKSLLGAFIVVGAIVVFLWLDLVDPLAEEIILKSVNGALVVGFFYVLWAFLDFEEKLLDRHADWTSGFVHKIEKAAGTFGFLAFMAYKLINNHRGLIP